MGSRTACTAAAKRQVQDAQTVRAVAEAELLQHQQQSRTEAVFAKRQQENQLVEVQRGADSKMREYVDKFRQQVGLATVACNPCKLPARRALSTSRLLGLCCCCRLLLGLCCFAYNLAAGRVLRHGNSALCSSMCIMPAMPPELGASTGSSEQ
jgi:hypothetical protein